MEPQSPPPRDAVQLAARQRPHSLALVCPSRGEQELGGRRMWSYQELDRWVDRVAARLLERGVEPGDRVGMRLHPSPESVALLHAVWRVGGILVPLNVRWTERETERALAAAGHPATVVSDGSEIVAARWNASRAPSGRPSPLDFEGEGARTGPAAILLTSGSSGTPRPVILSHGHLAASAEASARRLKLSHEDRWLALLSPSHVGGLALLHRAGLLGCALIPLPWFDPEMVEGTIEHEGVTHVSLVPVMLQRLLDCRGSKPAPSSLRCILLGGAPTPLPLLERALRLGYPVALTYGLTEASSQVATAPPQKVRRKPGSVGRPLRGVELTIREAAGAARTESHGGTGVGEILVRGPTVVRSLPERQAERDPGPSPVHVDGDGWLHTGDLGHLDPDGDLWITGRASDRIVTGGVTVEPGEVEETILSHPDVAEVAVVGLPHAEWGESLMAVIVPVEGSVSLTLEDLLDFVRPVLTAAKRPRALRIVESLPRNPNGKVDRKRIREIVLWTGR